MFTFGPKHIERRVKRKHVNLLIATNSMFCHLVEVTGTTVLFSYQIASPIVYTFG